MSLLSLSYPPSPFSPLSRSGVRSKTMASKSVLLVRCGIESCSRLNKCGIVRIERNELNFINGSRIVLQSNALRIDWNQRRRRRITPHASWIATSQIASQAFTWGTVAVLPFYTLMVLAPNSKLTRKTMESMAPYVILGFLYAYLLYLSWTPETIKSMFASKYWLPELSGIARMFSNEITVSSAWIHLLAVDLFAARQVFHDGLQNNIETRHSISLCLLFCPIGIVTHAITKLLTKPVNDRH
ncbi:hypothetical protein LUZ60_009908 [Juncus effusus]|nr:hypothetical protein LUZ60_009908 [Juncus effusus]